MTENELTTNFWNLALASVWNINNKNDILFDVELSMLAGKIIISSVHLFILQPPNEVSSWNDVYGKSLYKTKVGSVKVYPKTSKEDSLWCNDP